MAERSHELTDASLTANLNESDTDSNDDSDSSTAVVPLATGREKRATAGNRMNRLLEAEEEEDEVTLLFAEDEEDEDVEFEGGDDEAGSDAQLDSSSDDDDDQATHAAADDDLEGERELEKKEKAEKAKKRKANDALTTSAGVRKKARFDPALTTKKTTAPTPKLSKKKERESWSMTDQYGPSRTSLRPQTVANTEVTRVRVKQTDAQHAKVVERLKKKRQEREKDAPDEMTQADRLAEAEKVEKKNAKSLNRWETLEKKRAEEQAAKLAALHDRKLEGPVVSWWSGVAKWLGPKLVKVGSIETTQEPVIEGKKRGRKPKGYYETLEPGKEGEGENSSFGTPRDHNTTPAPSEVPPPFRAMAEPAAVLPETAPPQITFAVPQGPDNFLHGIHEYASLPHEAVLSTTALPPLQPIPAMPLYSSVAAHSSIQPARLPTLSKVDVPYASIFPPPPPPPPPPPGDSTRNLVILSHFDNLPAKHSNEYAFFSNNRKTPKPPKQAQELCVITSLPARYRDPTTGLAYANSFAYNKLQEVKQHGFTWSSMVGCYVGAIGVAARGVPDGFLGS